MKANYRIAQTHKAITVLFLISIILFSIFDAGSLVSVQAQQKTSTSLSGWFTIVRGDNSKGLIAPQDIYLLITNSGQTTRLLMDAKITQSMGGLLALDRKYINTEGTWLESAALSTPGTFQVNSITTLREKNAISNNALPVVSGPQPWISIMCKFSDNSVEPQNLSYFQGMYTSVYPGLDHYWREASYNSVNIMGSTATGWYTLPHPRSYYVYNGSLDLERAVNDCTFVADPTVNFSNFVGINLMFNNDLDGFAYGGGWFLNLDGASKIWNITWEPPWGYGNIAVMAHEMGHGFGLPHSSGNYGLTYDNQWDVMSDTWSNCDRSTDVTYGCLGQHTISYHKDILGWIPSPQKYNATWGSSTTISLEQLSLPQTGNYKMAQVPIGGSNTHFYTVEVRRQTGYDYKLPAQAVIIHEIDTTRDISAHVIDVDNNGNTGDAGATWTVGEVFRDTANNISVAVLAQTTTGFRVNITLGMNIYYIGGNVGLSGTVVNYTGGSTTADSNGNYLITVPPNWSGVITPINQCYSFMPTNRTYNNVLIDAFTENYTPSSPTSTCTNIDVLVGGANEGSYILASSGSQRVSYALNSGPVKLISTNDISFIGAERAIYKVNGTNTSFSEMMALPNGQLDNTYWLPWYNNVDLDTQLRIANVSGTTATVHVHIGGVEMSSSPFTLSTGESTRISFPGINNGPVKIASNVNIVAAERVIYKVNGVNTSFSEMMALPNGQLNNAYWLPWYNNMDLDTQLRFGNVSGSTATVHVLIGGVEMTGSPYILAPGASTRQSFVVNNGPVQIVSDQNIVAAERVIYKVNNLNTSFSEMMALPNSQLSKTYWLPWYNNVDLDTQLRIANVSNSTATVNVYIGGTLVTSTPITLQPGESTRKNFAANNGPVQIVSDQNIVAAERMIYKVNNLNTSFSELMALPDNQLNMTYWLPWYNNIDLDTQLRFAVP